MNHILQITLTTMTQCLWKFLMIWLQDLFFLCLLMSDLTISGKSLKNIPENINLKFRLCFAIEQAYWFYLNNLYNPEKVKF